MSNQIGPSTGTGPKGVHVLLVCRESRRRKDDSEGSENLESQEAKLREWAKQNIPGLKGIEVLKLDARPRGAVREQLLQVISSTESKLLLTCSIDRLERTAFLGLVLDKARQRGIRIRGIDDSFDSNSEAGSTLIALLAFDTFLVNHTRRPRRRRSDRQSGQ